MIGMPHDNVWTRLGTSKIHGIGVFAIRHIPSGTSVFGSDSGTLRWVDAERTADLTEPQKRLYADFAIRDGTKLGCPINFNMLSVGWYLNEPAIGQLPNIAVGEGYAMVASRDIEEGEELTVVYRTFSV